MPGPRNLQSLTVEYLVTGELDGVTPAPPINLGPDGATAFDKNTQVYDGGTHEAIGLIDPDFVTGGGSIGARNITAFWIDTTAVGDPGASLDVVGVRSGNDVALQKQIEDLTGDAGIFLDDGFLVPQGSDIRINGFTAPAGRPIRIRISIAVPKDVADYVLQMIANKL